MASFLFCLIFIQVSIFFITGIVLVATFWLDRRASIETTSRATCRGPVRQRRQIYSVDAVSANAGPILQ